MFKFATNDGHLSDQLQLHLAPTGGFAEYGADVQYAQPAHLEEVLQQFVANHLEGLRRAGANLAQLDDETSLLLMVELSRYPEVVEVAGESLEPHAVAQYLRELAYAFHTWYAGTPETDRFKANDSGQAVLVSMEGPGATPAVEVIKKEVALFDKYEAAFKLLAKLHVIPKKTDRLMQRMNENSQSYIKAEEEELLTLNWHCVGEKPA